MSTRQVDVAIIGAGWYGLVAARTYLRLRPETDVLIIDSDKTVGGVWSKDRLYPNLVAQVKVGFFEYSDTPMPKSGTTKNGMVTGFMIHDYLQKYAEDHELMSRIRFNTFVERVERISDGWRLHSRDSDDIIETEKLLVATGVTSIPSLPTTFSVEGASIPVIHSKQLGSSSQLIRSDDVETVTVVGASKSAYDAVYMLLSMGKQVNWLIRPDGSGPLAIVPADFFGFINGIATSSTRLMTYLSPSILNSTGALSGFFQRSRIGRWCTGAFWDTITYLSNQHAGYGQEDHVSALKPDIDSKSIFWANSGLGIVTLPDFWPRIHKGNVKIIRDNIASIKEDTLLLRGGQTLRTDWLVLCTGWGDHYAMFDADLKAELGLPLIGKPKALGLKDKSAINWEMVNAVADRTVNERFPLLANTPKLKYPYDSNISQQRHWKLYRRSIPIDLALNNDRSLAILGQIHTAQTPLVSEIQSFWTILYMLGEINLPDEATMTKEIAEWNAWTRKRYLSQGQKAPYAIYDFLSYVDAICQDLGINSRRKSNALAELLIPYRPSDFNGFIDEWQNNRSLELNDMVSSCLLGLKMNGSNFRMNGNGLTSG